MLQAVVDNMCKEDRIFKKKKKKNTAKKDTPKKNISLLIVSNFELRMFQITIPPIFHKAEKSDRSKVGSSSQLSGWAQTLQTNQMAKFAYHVTKNNRRYVGTTPRSGKQTLKEQDLHTEHQRLTEAK